VPGDDSRCAVQEEYSARGHHQDCHRDKIRRVPTNSTVTEAQEPEPSRA
jgi:hypothetical protein